MSWISRNAPQIEAIAAGITALVAIVAIVGVKIQLDAADQLQRSQSARDAYRGHLAMAVANPSFAQPLNGCEILESDQAMSYVAFVSHLLYSAEQMLEVGRGWEATFIEELGPHTDYLCTQAAPLGDTEQTIQLLSKFRSDSCGPTPTCSP